ncbi:MAG: hypothetical protein RLZZ214_1705 [Verrucomicrobiota bacterium]
MWQACVNRGWLVAAVAILPLGISPARGEPLSQPGDVLWANPLETEADFTAGEGKGTLEKLDGRAALRINQTDGTTSALWMMEVPVEAVRGKWVYLSADMKGAGLSAKPLDWNGVKVMLKVENPAGTQWPQVATPAAAFDWKRLSTRILIPADATRLTLHLGMELVTGTAWFDNVSVTLAREVRDAPAAPADQPVFKGHALPALRGAMAHPQMKREDLRVFAEEWGGNLIRWQLLHLPKPGTEQDYAAYDRWLDKELGKLDEVLRWAKELGVLVVVDLHSPPGGRISGGNVATATGDFWATAAAQEHFVEVWQRIAARYKGEAASVWGFDLLNEPDDRTVTASGSDWQTLAARAAKAVRGIDPGRTLIIEPAMGGSAEGFTGFAPVDLPNIVYSFHMYTPFTYTHQGVDAPAAPIGYPGQIDGQFWDRAALEASMAPAIAFARKYRVHLYVGEFSTIRWSPGADIYLKDALAVFESHGWDWSYHAFREWHGWNLELGPDRNQLTPEQLPNARLNALLKWTRQNQRAR